MEGRRETEMDWTLEGRKTATGQTAIAEESFESYANFL